MQFETIRIDGDGPVRHLVLDRPEVHNAVSSQLLADVHAACVALDGDRTVRVVIIRGEGKSFCSGADLKQAQLTVHDDMIRAKDGSRMYDTVRDLNAVTIAACHGYLIGGGAVLPMACDFRVGAPSVSLTVNEVSIGFSLSWHSIPALVSLVGPHKAKEMLILGRTYGLAALDAMGFWTDTVDDEADLIPAAERLAAEVLRQPPVPVMASKASINAQAAPLASTIQHLDHVVFGYVGRTENAARARRTYFSDEPREWADD